MKKILLFIVLLMALMGCTMLRVRKPEPTATGNPQVNRPNPASVYCLQKGHKLEIRTAANGSQNGFCVFSDGSACNEWAYYRGVCGLAAQEGAAPTMVVEAIPTANGGVPEADTSGENNASSDMPPGAEEKISGWWGLSKARSPAHNMMTTSSGRIWGRSFPLAFRQRIRQYRRRSKHYAT